ncbi:MAG: MerR family transcriptional regulator [Planctomycetota bacterium]
MDQDVWTVGQVARMARITVRSLHHYDSIGLLVPSARSGASYRLYTTADLERLQRIRVHQALGLSLKAIARVLDEPSFDRRAELRALRDTVEARMAADRRMLTLLDRTLESLGEGRPMVAEEMFDGFDADTLTEEAEGRWGDTEAWRESQRRTRTYGPREWEVIRSELESIERDLAELLGRGVVASAPEAIAIAARHRAHLQKWFYDCDAALHVGLGALYTDDPRFRERYERITPGLAVYFRAAIEANAERNGVADQG